MVSEKLKVVNKMGFHMRPASAFVNEMSKFKSQVTILFDGGTINAKSIMNVMAACMKCGSDIEIVCDGEDEADALKSACDMIRSGFGEE